MLLGDQPPLNVKSVKLQYNNLYKSRENFFNRGNLSKESEDVSEMDKLLLTIKTNNDDMKARKELKKLTEKQKAEALDAAEDTILSKLAEESKEKRKKMSQKNLDGSKTDGMDRKTTVVVDDSDEDITKYDNALKYFMSTSSVGSGSAVSKRPKITPDLNNNLLNFLQTSGDIFTVLSEVIKPSDALLFVEIGWEVLVYLFNDCTINHSPENSFTSFKDEIKNYEIAGLDNLLAIRKVFTCLQQSIEKCNPRHAINSAHK